MLNLSNIIEPIKEFIFASGSFNYRKMRLLGRIPRFRKYTPNPMEHPTSSPNEPISGLHPLTFVEKAITGLRQYGYYDGIAVDRTLLDHLHEIVKSSQFTPRDLSNHRDQNLYNIDPLNLQNPGGAYLYALLNPHLKHPWLHSFISQSLGPVAKAYLNSETVSVSSQIWASFDDGGRAYNPDFGFHYDLDDYRFLKFFLYLSNVDSGSGPHQVVESSHQHDHFFRFFNRRLREHSRYLDGKTIKTFVGNAGTCFFEDTLCYHRGVRPEEPRLVFQAEFCINDY